MKPFGALILAVLILRGCAAAQPREIQPAPLAATAANPALTTLEPAHSRISGAGLQACSLDDMECVGLIPWEENLLLRIREGTEDKLLLLTGDTLEFTGQTRLPAEAGLWVHPGFLSFYDAGSCQMVLLDMALAELRRLDTPPASGTPLLSPDGSVLYHCRGETIYALEFSSGISRVVKTGVSGLTGLTAVEMDGSVLQAQVYDEHWGFRAVFLSVHTGETLTETEGGILLLHQGQRFYARFSNGAAPSLVFGTAGEPAMALYPRNYNSQCFFLPRNHGAAVWVPEEGRLEYYDLHTGHLAAMLTLPEGITPREICGTGNGVLWFLASGTGQGEDVLYRWDTRIQAPSDGQIYTGPHYTRQYPDHQGLARCRSYARELEQVHGLRILIGEDVLECRSWDWDLEPEYRADLTFLALERLDSWLSRFPQGFFPALGQNGGRVTLCLVRNIADSSGLDSLQLRRDGDAYILLALGDGMEAGLYREIAHVADTAVLTRCNAFDQWEKLNPRDFAYDYSYSLYPGRETHPYLTGDSRAFVDSFSMSYPREDRAVIFESAMLPGNEALFRCPILQRKLLTVCNGLRQAFSLEDWPQVLPWEQYLLTRLAPEE